MAWSNSVMFSDTFVDLFEQSIALAFDTGDTWKVALFQSSITVDANTADTANAAYNTAPFNSGESTGTAWAAGGVALAGQAVTVVNGYGIKFDATDVSVTGTTITAAAYGCLVYDSTVSNRALVAVNFGSGYTTSNGTFGITWDSNGIARIDLTP